MIAGAIPLVTPAVNLSIIIGQVASSVVTGAPAQIAVHLNTLAQGLTTAGHMELGGEATRLALQLETGEVDRTDAARSSLLRRLREVKEALDRGSAIDEALVARTAAGRLKEMTGGTSRLATSITARVTAEPFQGMGLPVIDWARFGTNKHPAPNPPHERITSAGRMLSSLVHYVGGQATDEESDAAVESFFDISGDVRRRIRDGAFVPKAIGRFPTRDARSLIDKSAGHEPLWGELMELLITYSTLECFGLPMIPPDPSAVWSDALFFDLGWLVAKKLLTEGGKKEVIKDRPLVQLVRRQADITKDDWHPGESRRDAIDRWYCAMSAGDSEGLRTRQRRLGDGILKVNGWNAPPRDAGEARRLQWLVRYWIAHEYYGALPPELPCSADEMVRFVFLPQIPRLDPAFVGAMRKRMNKFYTASELGELAVRR